MKVVGADCALRLRAVLDFTHESNEKVTAGDEWLFEGPGTYIPRKEVKIEEQIKSVVIKPNQAVKLRARKECIDRMGVRRVTGEEWIVKKVGAYLPLAYEQVVCVLDAHVLTKKNALHMRANKTFVDDFGKNRLNGDEWLITAKETETHICNVYEEVVGIVSITCLSARQYAVVMNAADENGKSQLGKKKLIRGETTFFLQPGEELLGGIHEVYVLENDEALVLKCMDSFMDDGVQRLSGERWMNHGPMHYVPRVEVEVVTRRRAIPLNDNEGIYVRDTKSGKIKLVIGRTYMLTEDEELWEKPISANLENILFTQTQMSKKTRRNKTGDAISCCIPHNGVVQLFDYKEKRTRTVFGPDMIIIEPDEQFTLISVNKAVIFLKNLHLSIALLFLFLFSNLLKN